MSNVLAPDLSVIIPTYKRKDSLFQLLRCLLAQENIAIEIIVVDQNPAGFFTTFEEKAFDKVTRILQAEPNASLARNNGFLNSLAAHLLFIDDDLVPKQDFCSKGLLVFTMDPSIQCYIPNVYTESGVAAAIAGALTKAVGGFGEPVFEIKDAISAAVFFTRDCYRLSGGFDPYIFLFARTAEDQEFFIRLRKKGIRLWFAPAIHVFHNEKVEGGCELRTIDYWLNRERCIRSWALRYRVHGNSNGKLSIKDIVMLCRSSFVNRKVLTGGWKMIKKNISLLKNAIHASAVYFDDHKSNYSGEVDFLMKRPTNLDEV